MKNAIVPALIAILAFGSFANETHILAEEGRWEEVGQLIRTGKYDVDEANDQGLTLSDIALNRGELSEFELHCYAHEYSAAQSPEPIATEEIPQNIEMDLETIREPKTQDVVYVRTAASCCCFRRSN